MTKLHEFAVMVAELLQTRGHIVTLHLGLMQDSTSIEVVTGTGALRRTACDYRAAYVEGRGDLELLARCAADDLDVALSGELKGIRGSAG